MKVKDLVSKIGNFGTKPYVYIQRGRTIIGEGNPDDVVITCEKLTVRSFIAENRGQIKIFVK